MRSWRYLSILISLMTVSATFIALPLTTMAAPQQAPAMSSTSTLPIAGAHYVIFTRNQVPIVNVSELGTLTVDVKSGTPSNFSYSWYYWGSANGQFAYASGTGQGSGNADHLTLTLAAQNISSWHIPGFQEPIHVKTAYLDRSSGFLFFTSLYSLTLHDFVDFPQPIVAGVPIRVYGPVYDPVTSGNHILFESSLGTGSFTFSSLPGSHTSARHGPFFPVSFGS